MKESQNVDDLQASADEKDDRSNNQLYSSTSSEKDSLEFRNKELMVWFKGPK